MTRDPGLAPTASKIVLRTGLAWLVMMALFGATLGTAFVPLGADSAILHLGLGLLMVFILWIVFMGLFKATALVRLAAFTALFWLIFLFSLTFNDYFTREWNGGGTSLAAYPGRIGVGINGSYPRARLPLDPRLTPYPPEVPHGAD